MHPMQRYPLHGVDKNLEKSVSILTIGSEILDGRVQDTNSQFIATELSKFGIKLNRILTCDDDLNEITSSLTFLAKQSSFIIVSGGLGPTTDDLTREGIALWAEKALIKNEDSLKRLEVLYAKRQRVLDPSNHKQALFPEDASIIDNHVGTAEGFSLFKNNTLIFSVPGVPKELKPMFQDSILPILQKECNTTPIERRSFRVFGLPESNVGSIIKGLNLTSDLFVSYRASFPEIHIVIKGKDKTEVDAAIGKAKHAVGNEFIFIEDQELGLPETVGHILLSKNKTIAVAESCTGGLLGSYLTRLAGSSSFFLGGYITYANERKINDLLVPSEILSTYGAVSEKCAIAMAVGARQKTGADIALSITGIAGPEGGSDEKPVGTFYIGIATDKENSASKNFFLSDRTAIRKFAAYKALDTLRRALT
jgi:nicotinamide-nucleotide amidase